MRTPSIVALCLLSGALLAAPLAGPAAGAVQGYPVRDSGALTRNPLYAAGALPRAACPQPAVSRGVPGSVARHLKPLFACLDRAWAARFAAARMPFAAPGVRFVTRPERTCGRAWDKDVQAVYCNATREIVFLLDRDVLAHPRDLYFTDVIAHEYGHHVQNMAGIWQALGRLPSRGRSEYYEQSRRHELQAECLAGAFLRSVWPSLRRTPADWRGLLAADRASGDETSAVRDHGKGRNIAAWLSRGFHGGSAGACNTWTATAASVA
ncbi:hypothetical protein Sru01_14290 [Sphaerisporangium rufum]|uniref:Metalloprotease n=1 Tax=Sphaerisporangium rufum TaxID=1381558 RepID=A0A919R3N4_9ACTN|nr:neutral zinc metallopeptidase [Sphaerisporangium rufum]GII76447.1 hypothetical protein Sru01_14290 [Sphaerisporangium rufum]